MTETLRGTATGQRSRENTCIVCRMMGLSGYSTGVNVSGDALVAQHVEENKWKPWKDLTRSIWSHCQDSIGKCVVLPTQIPDEGQDRISLILMQSYCSPETKYGSPRQWLARYFEL